MAVSRVASFIDNLRDTQLLDPKQLAEVARNPLAKGDDPMPLARDLIQRQALTAYQVNQLVRGRGKELVLGPYRLLDRLGEGGMGQVYKAFHQPMNRVVALKVIKKEKLAKAEAVSRFYQEIRAAAQLHHPNIVVAYDAGQADDTHFFAMEFVEGTDLSKLVKDKGPLPVYMACHFIGQAALGLQHAHEKGMVHRDIKPANLLLSKKGVVKVLDMGLARLQNIDGDTAANDLTKTGTVVGTPDYLAPEQARNSRGVDVRADLYSLGCTFYFLLTGRPPFHGEHLTEVLLQHQTDPPPSLDKFRKDVPPGVQAIVSKLLAKKPDERFQTPAELAAALKPFTVKGAETSRAIQVAPGVANGALAETIVSPGMENTPDVSRKPAGASLGRKLRSLPKKVLVPLIVALAAVPLFGLCLLSMLLSSGKDSPGGSPVAKGSTEPAKSTEPRPEYLDLLASVREAIKDNRVTQTKVHGGVLEAPHADIPPDGALLIGFKVSIGRLPLNKAEYISSLRPIYLTAQGEKLGAVRGKELALIFDYRPKTPGYAVGSITFRHGITLHGLTITGLQLTYNRIGPKSLLKSDQKSEWIGHQQGEEVSLGGTGAPVIGIQTRENDGNLTGLGLVLMGK